MNIAHCLTLLRLIISPIFLLIYLEHDFFGIDWNVLPFVLLGLFVVSEISDALDGYLARRFNLVSDLGKIMDPMADSIYRITIFLAFTLPPISLPIFPVFIFFYRDLLINALRTICALKGFALGARLSGKIKAILQAVVAFVLVAMLIPYSWGILSQENLHSISTTLVTVTAIYTLFSGVDYIYSSWDFIKSLLVKESVSSNNSSS